mgnify:CR=1 FL=1
MSGQNDHSIRLHGNHVERRSAALWNRVALEARLDTDMALHEQSCIAKSGLISKEQLRIIDMTREVPDLTLLEDTDGVFIGGTGDYSVAKDRPAFFEPLVEFTKVCLEKDVPTLGLCYGFHLMALAVGGRVIRDASKGESGTFEVILTEQGKADIVLRDFPERFLAQQGHNDVVEDVPAPFEWLATSERCRWQGLKHPTKPFYGLQFHPEVVHTPRGKEVLANFVHGVCGCGKEWTMRNYVDQAVDQIRAQVGRERVILGLSGGVDSSVAAAPIRMPVCRVFPILSSSLQRASTSMTRRAAF